MHTRASCGVALFTSELRDVLHQRAMRHSSMYAPSRIFMYVMMCVMTGPTVN